jgi:competence ComEA-like helix-hairpin-helix protein
MRDVPDYMVSYNIIQRAEVRQSRIQSFAFVISVCVGALFSIGFAVSSLVAVGQAGGIELDERINPNDAPIASLVRLPGIGIGRAEAIVACREDLIKEDSNGRAFRSSDDLQKVKGIGPKTVQNISEWLKFE